ncbi:hypothetical protein SRABI26_04400 [Arthrobacter sp. Bi26]|nr:hypothetical protein SRABI26_04400 [Arthrobacter sp. Bi26]
MYRGSITPRKVAVLALNLPRGAQTWRAVGGAGAVTAEVEAAWIIEHTLLRVAHGQAGGKGKAPEMRDYPAGLLEEAAKAAFTQSRAERFRQKHLTK